MRAFLVSTMGVTCTAALVLPLAAPAGAAPDAPARDSGLPGSTQSLPLDALPPPSARATGAPAGEWGLAERQVRPFSLAGVVWDDVDAELHGTAQVRVRATGTHRWSGWQDLETHNAEHAPDPGSAERAAGAVKGSTAPLWVGPSDGVEVRVRPEAPGTRGGAPCRCPPGCTSNSSTRARTPRR